MVIKFVKDHDVPLLDKTVTINKDSKGTIAEEYDSTHTWVSVCGYTGYKFLVPKEVIQIE